jgi:four helix bundle protein
VEGSSRRGSAEFRRFLDIALGSLSELGYALRFASEVGLLPNEAWKSPDDQHNRARFLTWKLYEAVRSRTRHGC